MKQHSDGRNVWRILVISFVLVLAWSCATTRPQVQSIRDFKDIAGKWEGLMTSKEAGAGAAPFTMIIKEDGTSDVVELNNPRFVNLFATHRTWELVGGKLQSKDGLNDVMTLYEKGGKRMLVVESDRFLMSCEPAKK